MADMNVPQKGCKRKIQSTRIDLTPMVDLGFLLITFFMFTTTLANHKVMRINMPSDDKTDKPIVFAEESTITLIPIGGHNVVYYEWILREPAALRQCPLSGIRNVLLNKIKQVAALPASYSKDAHRLHVIIKPDEQSCYSDLVALLDEMAITQTDLYAIADISPGEKEMLRKRF